MIIVKTILELDDNKTKKTDIVIKGLDASEVEALLDDDELALADYISNEIGFLVNEIISWSEPDYIIKWKVLNMAYIDNIELSDDELLMAETMGLESFISYDQKDQEGDEND